MILRFIVDLINLYLIVLFVRIIFTWVPVNPWSKWAKVVHWLAKVTDPVLVPVRRLLPPIRFGGTAIDLSPMVVFIAIRILLNVLVSH